MPLVKKIGSFFGTKVEDLTRSWWHGRRFNPQQVEDLTRSCVDK